MASEICHGANKIVWSLGLPLVLLPMLQQQEEVGRATRVNEVNKEHLSVIMSIYDVLLELCSRVWSFLAVSTTREEALYS